MPAPSYKLNEIFYSIQGEGAHTGTAAVFVRLAGCSMECPFCDTDYSVKFEKSDAEILDEVKKYPAKTVVITGGEPSEQDLPGLAWLLNENGYGVHVETNGAIIFDRGSVAHLAVSPKVYVDERMLKAADAVKLLVGAETDLEDIKKYFKYGGGKTQIFLQPLNNTQENVDLCVKLVKENPSLKLSLQTHKFAKIK